MGEGADVLLEERRCVSSVGRPKKLDACNYDSYINRLHFLHVAETAAMGLNNYTTTLLIILTLLSSLV